MMRRKYLENENSKIKSNEAYVSDKKSSPQDRSYEFQSVVLTLTGFSANRRDVDCSQRNDSSFTTISKKVRKDICFTSEKLQKLNMMLLANSLKDENVSKLVEIIKQDISNSTNQLTKLQQAIKMNKMNHQYVAHSNAAIFAMQSMLGTISTELKTLLETRHQLMVKETRDEFIYDESNTNKTKEHQSVVNMHKNAPNASSTKNTSQHYNPSLYAQPDPLTYSPQSYQAQQDQILRHRAAPQRLNEMKGIEQTIVELGDIFQQLAQMVQDQEHVVNRIDSHVDMTALNVEAAHGELSKYLRYISMNRSFYIKIFIVLILTFVGILFIMK